MSCCRLLLLTTGAALVACLVDVGTGWEERRGVVHYYSYPITIQLADTVTMGVPSRVGIVTYGGGCMRPGHTDVSNNGLDVAVEPFDSVNVGADVCTLELALYDHVVDVQFAERGVATVRFIGRQEPADTVITVTRTVVVQ